MFVLASTIQVVPQLMWQSNIINEAQQARGVETTGSLWQRIKTFIPMMGPLVLSSVEQNEEKVLTLQARGFSNPTPEQLCIIFQKENRLFIRHNTRFNLGWFCYLGGKIL
ncbi:energy-coupling factor transporter transmembrane component T [Lactobacillus sp. R2/2]|nr:energy-coupling factor transporter transmembrane component T [Lactobacillus sp. R2/2]